MSRANPFGSFKQLKKYPVIIGLIVAMIFVYIASHAVQSTWSFYTKYEFDWSNAEVGYSLAFVGVLSALVQGVLIRWLIPKIGQKRSVYFGMMFYTVGLIFFGYAFEGWMMYPAMVVYCLGGIAGPCASRHYVQSSRVKRPRRTAGRLVQHDERHGHRWSRYDDKHFFLFLRSRCTLPFARSSHVFGRYFHRDQLATELANAA